MSILDSGDWSEVERLAQLHEAHVNKVMSLAGLPLVKIEVSDRLRGCIVEAMNLIEGGYHAAAHQTLQEGLKL